MVVCGAVKHNLAKGTNSQPSGHKESLRRLCAFILRYLYQIEFAQRDFFLQLYYTETYT